jgi:hypothetical protein
MPNAEKDTVWSNASVMQFVLTVSETPKTHVVFHLILLSSICPSLERESQTIRKLSSGRHVKLINIP